MPLIPVSFLRDCHTFVLLKSLEQLRSDRKNVSLCFYKTFSLPFPSSLLKLPFETRTATGREHFACQDSGVSQIFILIISNGEKILGNVNVVV